MQKAEFMEHLHQDLERDPELLRACKSVVSHLAKVHSDEWRHITFGMLSRVAGLDDALHAVPVAQYLASSRAQLLRRCFLLVTDGKEYEMDDEVIEEAFRSHVLFHPDKGEPIGDFEKALHVYFTVSESGKGVLGSAS